MQECSGDVRSWGRIEVETRVWRGLQDQEYIREQVKYDGEERKTSGGERRRGKRAEAILSAEQKWESKLKSNVDDLEKFINAK